MSLLHRTSSTESFTRRSRGTSPSTSDTARKSTPQNGNSTYYDQEDPSGSGRKLSYNPVGQWVPEAARESPIGAYEVPKARRIGQIIVASTYCLLAAGIVFGYAALKPVLIGEGIYREQCSKEELRLGVEVCYEQELRLNFMFTIAAVVTNVSALPVGAILDRFGPRVASIIGSLCVAAGCLFLSFASSMPFDGYVPGYLFLALGGPFVFISSFQLSNAFPRYSGLILALLTGCFDTSSAIFLFYRLAYTASDNTFRPRQFFLIYLAVPAFILTANIILMPGSSYKTVGELVKNAEDVSNDVHDSDADRSPQDTAQLREARRQHRESVVSEITTLLGSPDASEQTRKEESSQRVSGVWGALHGKTALQQIRTPWFILIMLFTAIQMTRINYFVATIRPQYAYLLNSSDLAARVNGVFDVALPLGGVIAVPFIGLLLDHTSTLTVLSLLVVVATTIGVLGVIPQLWAAYANIALFVIYRPLYYTAVSDYSAKVFGFATFGRVYGLIICLAGVFNFVQSGLDALTYKRFARDPRPVNIILLVAAFVVGVSLCGYVGWHGRTMRRRLLEDEASASVEREHLMPGGEEHEDRHPIDVHAGENRRRDYGATNHTTN